MSKKSILATLLDDKLSRAALKIVSRSSDDNNDFNFFGRADNGVILVPPPAQEELHPFCEALQNIKQLVKAVSIAPKERDHESKPHWLRGQDILPFVQGPLLCVFLQAAFLSYNFKVVPYMGAKSS
jgi:hypothetical protein